MGQNRRWNVAILPYLEETSLYAFYDGTYGPDAPPNIAIGRGMPATLTCPSDLKLLVVPSDRIAAHYSTNFLLMEKPLCVCTDGTSRTVLATELRSSSLIPWTRGPAFHIGAQDSAHGKVVNLLFCDGHVDHVNGDDEEMMKAIGTPNGGEIP
jgi:prepilin-type processing-associated H-X9-DG protein